MRAYDGEALGVLLHWPAAADATNGVQAYISVDGTMNFQADAEPPTKWNVSTQGGFAHTPDLTPTAMASIISNFIIVEVA